MQMTQIFDKSGMQKAVTVLKLKKTQLCGKRNAEKDSYNADIFAWVDEKFKPPRSQEKRFKIGPARMIKEERNKAESTDEPGKEVGISDFKVGEKVSVESVSKGKGFAGTVKRHGFTTGPKTHGSCNWRKPGSIGPTYPQRTIKGRRMAGHMGARRSSVKNLEIVAIRENEGEIWVAGSVPGANKSIVVISK
ncbi:MAG: 50S ribosomal protein L3 [Candidatus Berkelbacteria bacterium]|nr:50S ribosomal protein L3 [Candidatus Berkelbacteria bacterium]